MRVIEESGKNNNTDTAALCALVIGLMSALAQLAKGCDRRSSARVPLEPYQLKLNKRRFYLMNVFAYRVQVPF